MKDKAMFISCTQETLDELYDIVKRNYLACQKAVTFPVIAKALCGDEEQVGVISYIIKNHLSDKLSIIVGYGGGVALKDESGNTVKLAKATNSSISIKDVPESLRLEVLEYALELLKQMPKGVSVGTVQHYLTKKRPDRTASEFNMVKPALLASRELEIVPGVGVRAIGTN